MPKGLKIKKFVKGPDGKLIQDESYVGEDGWDDDSNSEDKVVKIIENDSGLNNEQKMMLKTDLGVSGEF